MGRVPASKAKRWSKMTSGSKKGGDKLYKQWVKHGDLTPESIPQKESPREVPGGKERTGQRSYKLYILLAVAIAALCVGLVLIFR